LGFPLLRSLYNDLRFQFLSIASTGSKAQFGASKPIVLGKSNENGAQVRSHFKWVINSAVPPILVWRLVNPLANSSHAAGSDGPENISSQVLKDCDNMRIGDSYGDRELHYFKE